MEVKGELSTTKAEFSTLEKLDQRTWRYMYTVYPYIWNSMSQSSTLLHPKCYAQSQKNTSCHTWMLKHWTTYNFMLLTLSHCSYLLKNPV